MADVTLAIGSQLFYLSARGNGPLDAVSNVLKIANPDIKYQFVDYEEHALETDSDSLASAYVVIADDEGNHYWGVGVDSDITMASVYALITAVNRENKGQAVYPHPRLNPRRVPPDIHRNFKRGGFPMGMTMTQKNPRCPRKPAGSEEPSQLIRAKLDMVLGNDITSPVAIREFDRRVHRGL